MLLWRSRRRFRHRLAVASAAVTVSGSAAGLVVYAAVIYAARPFS